ncbi:YkgJ family cysteine cluster protein [Candidatus Woesearchaeota archaeon]|nr:YkgJ family cysteine cluster protein [Candidatus Woesearchaeota archaeon]
MIELFKKQNFQCNRYCGECCKKLIVQVSKKEIGKIAALGHKKEEFAAADLIDSKKFVLKKNHDGCVFLKKHKDGKYSCSIYENRPKICRQYPFFKKNAVKSCLPSDLYPIRNNLFK